MTCYAANNPEQIAVPPPAWPFLAMQSAGRVPAMAVCDVLIAGMQGILAWPLFLQPKSLPICRTPVPSLPAVLASATVRQMRRTAMQSGSQVGSARLRLVTGDPFQSDCRTTPTTPKGQRLPSKTEHEPLGPRPCTSGRGRWDHLKLPAHAVNVQKRRWVLVACLSTH